MSQVDLANPVGEALVFTPTAGIVPAVAVVDPVTGDPFDAATEATLAAIREMSEGLQYYMAAMLDKMSIPSRMDQTRALIEDASSNILGSPYYVFNVNGVSNPTGNGAQMYRMLEPWNFADAGAARLYASIQVA